jgi:hypothetical protein
VPRTRPVISGDIPAAEVFPIVLFVLLLILESVAAGVYAGLRRPYPDGLPAFEMIAAWLTISAWFYPYARRHRISLIMDYGWLLIGFWVIAVPYYLFKTQGRRTFIPIAAYVALAIALRGLEVLVRHAAAR